MLFYCRLIPRQRIFVLVSVCILGATFTRGNAQVTEILTHYVDSTSMLDIRFELSGLIVKENGRLIISPSTNILLSSTAKRANVGIGYRVDNASPAKYNLPFSIAEGGDHEIAVAYLNTESQTESHSFPISIDAAGPAITALITYKSVTLKRFHLLETKGQNGPIIVECPVGSELKVLLADNYFATPRAFLKEDNAILRIIRGSIELRSRGKHKYQIVASDLLGNSTESPQILLDIVEQ